MLPNFINSFAIALSLSTATGIFVHDTKIDKAVTTLSLPPAIASAGASSAKAMLDNMPHTHSERTSFAQAVHDLKAQNPRIQPRSNDDKKHLLQKRVAKGHHAFDNYNLPIV